MRAHRGVSSLACLGLVVLLFGCDRYVDLDNPIGPVPGGPAAPVNITALLDNQAVTLAWEVVDSTAAGKFRIYMADSTGKSYIRKDSSLTYGKTVSNLTVNQRVWFKVAAVSSSGDEGPSSVPLAVRVGVIGMVIDNGLSYTRDRNVTVAFTAPIGTTHIQLAESPVLSSVTPQTFTQTRTYTISTGDGTKTLYAKYIMGDGTIGVAQVSDDIVLDTRAAIDSVYFTSVATPPYEAGDVIKFFVKASESGGEAQVNFAGAAGAITLYDDGLGGDVTANDGLYSTNYTVPVNLAVGGVNITGSFTDGAGNRATNMTSSKTLTIIDYPDPVEFTIVTSNSTYLVDLNWYASNDADFAYYRLYRSTSAGVSDTSKLVATIAGRTTDNWTDTALAANTQYYYRIYVVNSTGASAASQVKGAKTLVNTAPAAVALAVNLTDATSAELTWSRSSEEDFLAYRIYRATASGVDQTDQLIAIINSRSTDTFSSYLQASGTYYFKIYVVDRHGVETGSNEVNISRP